MNRMDEEEKVIEKSFNIALEASWYDGLIAASQHYVVNLDSLREEMTRFYRGYPQNFGYFDARAEEMVESLVRDICLAVGSFLEAEVSEWERQQERAFEEGKRAKVGS